MGKHLGLGLILSALWTAPASTAHAGKLDLNIYSSEKIPQRSYDEDYRSFKKEDWRPGAPRYLRGESRWVQTLSHLGYAGLGIGGLVVSVASGGVAPAIGFGIVSVWQLWQLHKMLHPRATSPAADG